MTTPTTRRCHRGVAPSAGARYPRWSVSPDTGAGHRSPRAEVTS